MANSGVGRFNPLYSVAGESAASKTASKTTEEADFYISSSRGQNNGGASSRRQAFIYGSSFYDHGLRPRGHDLFEAAEYNPRYQDRFHLQVPTTTVGYNNRYSFDSARPRKNGLESTASASFRHHSVDSPDQIRRMHFG